MTVEVLKQLVREINNEIEKPVEGDFNYLEGFDDGLWWTRKKLIELIREYEVQE